MNATVNMTTAVKTLTCGVAALVITAALSFSFVESTEVVPDFHHPSPARIAAIDPTHAWFGQPQPAVLVD